MRVIDLANFVRQKIGSTSSMEFKEFPQDDPHMRRPDISKAMRLLGWAPEVDLESGLDDVVEWFRRQV
jgi:nucleoside-diphosphate-sugar epimerase